MRVLPEGLRGARTRDGENPRGERSSVSSERADRNFLQRAATRCQDAPSVDAYPLIKGFSCVNAKTPGSHRND